MLIDDNALDQKLYLRLIKRSGLVETLHQMESAEAALAFFRDPDQPVIDAILLDIRMPRMDGFEFLERATTELADGFAEIAVIMLTTSMSAQDRARADGFDIVKGYITKPLTEAHLQMIIDTLREVRGEA